jgi:flagellin
MGGTQTGTATWTGSSAATLTIAGGQAATAAGVIGTGDLSNWKDTSSAKAYNVNGDNTISYLDVAISGVAQARADFGASINTLEHSIDNLNVAVQNTSAARSAVMDADYAAETTELARTQILAQAATAMLSQANQQAQSVLALLK